MTALAAIVHSLDEAQHLFQQRRERLAREAQQAREAAELDAPRPSTGGGDLGVDTPASAPATLGPTTGLGQDASSPAAQFHPDNPYATPIRPPLAPRPPTPGSGATTVPMPIEDRVTQVECQVYDTNHMIEDMNIKV